MRKKELKKMAFRLAGFRLQVELGDFENWTFEDGLTQQDKETLLILVDEIAMSLSQKGRIN